MRSAGRKSVEVIVHLLAVAVAVVIWSRGGAGGQSPAGLSPGLSAGLSPGLPAGLSPAAVRALSVFAWAVVHFIAGVLDDYIVGLTMVVMFVLVGAVPFATSFSVFSSSTWWMILGTLGLGVAVQRSGLLARLSLKLLLSLPNTYAGQCAGLVLSGLLLGPSLASVTGKVAIASKFVLGMHQALDLPDKSRHSAGLFMSMYTGFVLSAPLYMTASVCGFIVLGLIPPDLKAGITWANWLVAFLPLVLCMVAGALVVIMTSLNPGREFRADRQVLKSQLARLGKPSRAEILTGAVLILTLIAWVTEPVHRVDTAIPALLALALLLWQKVLDRRAFDTLPWSTLVFLGVILNLGTVFPKLGIDAFLARLLSPALQPLTASPALFLMVTALLVVALRFVVVSYNALTSILMVSLMPLAATAGIQPVILGQILHVVGQAVFLMAYQNPVYLVGYQGSEGRMSSHTNAFRVSLGSLAGCLVGIGISTLLWVKMRLIGGK